MMPTPLSPPSSLPRSPDPSEALHTYRECDLRQLARTITENVELYLQSLESHGQMPPTFFPDSEYGISQDGSGKAAQRALIDAAERIIALTTGPPGLYGISRQYLENSSLTVVAELDVANIIPIDGELTASEIAEKTGAETGVIVRIMRPLTAIFIFDEVSPQTYRHTARSAAMRNENVKALIEFGGIDGAMAAAYLPQALKASGYKAPIEPEQSAFSVAFNGGTVGYFDHVYGGKHDEMGIRFTKAMAATVGFSYESGSFASIYPFANLFPPTASAPGTIVDLGGGKGHIMISIATQFPDSNLHYVIQDLPSNVQHGASALPSHLGPKFTWMPHDFFTPQPVRHAEAYFLRHILHDWPDHYCQKILGHVVNAMKPGYSRLLIADMVVPEMNADKGVAHRDMLMMVHTTGLERTERQWADLLASVNPRLRILKVWKLPESPPGGFRVIEVLLETAEGARDVYKNAD